MNFLRERVRNDERGTALILAIAFMLIIGGISGALLSSVASGLNSRHSLDQARNREYAADGGVEQAIAEARPLVASWSTATYAATPQNAVQTFLNSAQCGPSRTSSLNQVNIRVDCSPAPALPGATNFEFNVIFSAVCTDPGCSPTPIVRAQVNFAVSGGTVSRTYVQSWSVNS